MPRSTKADLEEKIKEYEKEIKRLNKIIIQNNEEYNKLVEEQTEQFKQLPEHIGMKNQIERLEGMLQDCEYTIEHKEKKEKSLRDKVQKLLKENEQLKKNLENCTMTEATMNEVKRNARNAGRKPMQEEKILQFKEFIKQGKKEQEICKLLNISRATYYRVKKSL